MIPWDQIMSDVARANLATFGDSVVIAVGLREYRVSGIPAVAESRAEIGGAPSAPYTHTLHLRRGDWEQTGAREGDEVRRGGKTYRILGQPFDDGAGWVRLELIEQ